MPYPNIHAARVADPAKFEPGSFRTRELPKSEGGKGGVLLIMGKVKGGDGAMVEQSYHFPADIYTVADVKAWLEKNGVKDYTLEPASGNRSLPDDEWEKRIVCQSEQELRAEKGEDGKIHVSGLAVPYGKSSEDLGGFREQFAPGAFAESLSENRDILADVEHDSKRKLGRRSKGSLALEDTPIGLRFTATLPDTTLARDTIEEIRSGLLDGVSVTFRTVADIWTGKGADALRTVNKAILRGITLTSTPAYRQTVGTLTLRSLEEHRQAEEPPLPPAPELPPEVPLETLRMQLDLAETENQG